MAAAIIPALIAGGFSVYEGQQARKAAEANKPPPPPAINPQADETALDDQRRKRLMSATGRDGTVLAPYGVSGSPLGTGASLAGVPPLKTALGA